MIEILTEHIHILFLLLTAMLLSSGIIALSLGMYGCIKEWVEEIKEIER